MQQKPFLENVKFESLFPDFAWVMPKTMAGYKSRAVVEWHQHYASLSSFMTIHVVGVTNTCHLNINEISEELEKLIVEKCPIYTDYILNFKLVISPEENGVWEARLYVHNNKISGSHFIATIDVSSLPKVPFI